MRGNVKMKDLISFFIDLAGLTGSTALTLNPIPLYSSDKVIQSY